MYNKAIKAFYACRECAARTSWWCPVCRQSVCRACRPAGAVTCGTCKE